jgi:hypothetical protein
MFTRVKKIWLIIGTILLLFIFLNPTYLNFKEFTGFTGNDVESLHKKANFIFCSVYQDNYNHKRYLGILKNFIDITPESMFVQVDSTATISRDSVTAVVDSAATAPIVDSTSIK